MSTSSSSYGCHSINSDSETVYYPSQAAIEFYEKMERVAEEKRKAKLKAAKGKGKAKLVVVAESEDDKDEVLPFVAARTSKSLKATKVAKTSANATPTTPAIVGVETSKSNPAKVLRMTLATKKTKDKLYGFWASDAASMKEGPARR
ncbi:hypothetical protein ACLB2K_018402 [Fragaria x ananassa]